MTRTLRGTLLGGAAVALAVSAPGAPNPPPDYERPPISYSRTKPRDEVAQLLPRIAAGEVKFAGTDVEILRALLRELHIPVESQVLVFSKTSAQASLIEPRNPRALYFSDSVYVGWVPGGLIEVAAIDPELGPVFYAFDPEDARDARRTLVRETSCLRCHGSTPSREIPALLARSAVTSRNGDPLESRDGEATDDTTPFKRRWGGWYVSGYTGATNHRGNAFGFERGGEVAFTPSEARPSEVSGFIDPKKYLAATSDIVALLVFQHQLAMHNSLTRAAQRVRRAMAESPTGDRATDTLGAAAEDVVDHLLFRDAAPVPSGIAGSEAFRRTFANNAPRSAHGDSLKDFSLSGRLFTNRCSFLIYSDSFRALPETLKDSVIDRLATALRDDTPVSRYSYLEKVERRRILEVLGETLPGFNRR